jgi:hypothetical protein
MSIILEFVDRCLAAIYRGVARNRLITPVRQAYNRAAYPWQFIGEVWLEEHLNKIVTEQMNAVDALPRHCSQRELDAAISRMECAEENRRNQVKMRVDRFGV